MISFQEITPRQIRALLLLLVLAPLIPTGLLVRLMFETVQEERAAARETIASAWQDTLSMAVRGLENSLGNDPASKPSPEKVWTALKKSFEHEVEVRLVGKDGRVLAGSREVMGTPAASAELPSLLPGAQVELYLDERQFVHDAVREQIASYTRTAIFTLAATSLIAGLAGWAFLRQIKTQELKTSSLATLAHELRTPVASMRLLLDTIHEGRCPDQPEYLELISRENNRLSRLVDQFLTHARLERGTDVSPLVPIDPADVVGLAKENLGARLHLPEVNFRCELASNLPKISGDLSSLVCLVENLLDNAWKYTGPNKEITLQVNSKMSGVEFAIRDNGIGIEPAEREAIFDQFHQVDHRLSRVAEGCGLGLSIVRRIVEMHRGRIRIESELSKGSTFYVWLPAA